MISFGCKPVDAFSRFFERNRLRRRVWSQVVASLSLLTLSKNVVYLDLQLSFVDALSTVLVTKFNCPSFPNVFWDSIWYGQVDLYDSATHVIRNIDHVSEVGSWNVIDQRCWCATNTCRQDASIGLTVVYERVLSSGIMRYEATNCVLTLHSRGNHFRERIANARQTPNCCPNSWYLWMTELCWGSRSARVD